MKNEQAGFVKIIVAIVVVVLVAVLVAWDNGLIPKYLLSINIKQLSVQSGVELLKQDSDNLSVQTQKNGLGLYSNKVFSNSYPQNWTIEEETVSSHGCSARVHFAQNSVPKQTLINQGKDYVNYLENPGSVISVSGGIGEIGIVSFDELKKHLSITEKYGKLMKMYFYQDEIIESAPKLDIDGTPPSLTYNFEFPKFNKKGITKTLVLNGKFPQTIAIYYIAPQKDFSEDLFNSVVSSIKNNLTTDRCDPFENSSLKKDQKIKVTLPADKVWKENNTYKVSWSTDLPLSSFSHYYVQLGSDIPKRVASNPGSYGLWKVDKSKNNLEINLNKQIIDEQLYNHYDNGFDLIKDTFFIRVTAFNEATPVWSSNPSSDSSLFSIEEPVAISIANQQNEQDAITSITYLKAYIANFRSLIEVVYDRNLSYASICSNGLINVNADTSFSNMVQGILTHQGVSDQSNAGISCVATKDKYAIEITFKKYSTTRGIYSYCIDSSGAIGEDAKYKLDKSTLSCKAQ